MLKCSVQTDDLFMSIFLGKAEITESLGQQLDSCNRFSFVIDLKMLSCVDKVQRR